MSCSRPEPRIIWLSMAFDWWGAENAIIAQLEGNDPYGRAWNRPVDALSVLRYALDISADSLSLSTVRITYEHAWFVGEHLGSQAAMDLAERIENRTATRDDLNTITKLHRWALGYSWHNYEPPCPSPGRIAALLREPDLATTEHQPSHDGDSEGGR